MRRSLLPISAVFLTFVLTSALGANAARAEDAPEEDARVRLRVVDAESGSALAGARAHIRGEGLEKTSGGEGELVLEDLEAGSVTLTIERAGYESAEIEAEVEPGQTTEIDVELARSSAEVEGIVVTVVGQNGSLRDVYHPSASMEGDELQRSLSSSVPATLDPLPGFQVQYNGPGAANPTVRGMPGDRVLMLEDGHRTGDIYWTAADHGVMVEPLSVKRMEVIRGPASLVYGSNALGGVVNAIRDDVPIQRPDEVEGTATTQFESVNTGLSSGGVLRAPAGPLAVYAEATGRRAGDTKTPAGPLEETAMRAVNMAAGASWIPDWGLVGASARYYDNAYGVPGEFDGELIPGGHPEGVTVDATRLGARMRAAYDGAIGVFDGVELKSNVTRYLHDEIEGVVGGEDVVGAAFDQLSTDTHLFAHRDAGHREASEDAVLTDGALGLSLQTRDLIAGGASPGTRSGLERSAGAFAYGELDWAPFRVLAGLRYDLRHVTSSNLEPLRVRTQERDIVKEVSPRDFHALSGSLSTLWEFASNWTLGATVARSFRNPGIEDLFSEGPHVADFSFDIGSPDLDSEIGLGADLFVRAERSGLDLELASYYNRIDDYIYYRPTGETTRVFREGAPPRETPVFEARGEDARFLGAEGRIQWEVVEPIVLDATASYTWAERRGAEDPLPFIPPLSARIEARYEGSSFFGSVGGKLSAPQNRVPRPVQVGEETREPQQPTDGYALLGAEIGWRREGRYADHTVMLEAENLTNRVWRDHLSRIKEVAPQPGRNIQLSYRAIF